MPVVGVSNPRGLSCARGIRAQSLENLSPNYPLIPRSTTLLLSRGSLHRECMTKLATIGSCLSPVGTCLCQPKVQVPFRLEYSLDGNLIVHQYSVSPSGMDFMDEISDLLLMEATSIGCDNKTVLVEFHSQDAALQFYRALYKLRFGEEFRSMLDE